MVPVTLHDKRTNWLIRSLPPTAPRVRQLPEAILRAALFGVIVGPVLGVFFGWSGPIRAAMISGTYSVVFYILCALPVGYAREYFVAHSTTRAKAVFVRGYLEIERVRFGGRLQCTLPGDSEVEGIVIPIFTLQPLIENAVRHGIARRVGGGDIVVGLTRTATRFDLSVHNDIEDASVSEADFFKSGHALDNIRERLRLIYGAEASIAVTVSLPNIVSVRIKAPIRPGQNGSDSHDPVRPHR